MITEREWSNLVERYESAKESKSIAEKDEDRYQSYADRLARKYSGLKKGSFVKCSDITIEGLSTFKVKHISGELIDSDLRVSVYGAPSGGIYSDLIVVYPLSKGLPENVTVLKDK